VATAASPARVQTICRLMLLALLSVSFSGASAPGSFDCTSWSMPSTAGTSAPSQVDTMMRAPGSDLRVRLRISENDRLPIGA
jgi:hypothetical protein